ncbi:hypothetical protein, partial [uncultured Nocardioides sp.]|uniref:hypothetical protein n=1 Tax=uncultured Nocardioides sp. TaxID=198441 RepID=UPI0025E2FD3C
MLGHAPVGFQHDAVSRRVLARLWWLSAAAFAASVVLGGAVTSDGQPALWLAPPLAFVWLSLTWRGSAPHPDPALLVTGGAIVVLAVVGF